MATPPPGGTPPTPPPTPPPPPDNTSRDRIRQGKDLAQLTEDILKNEGRTTKAIEDNIKGLDKVVKLREKIEAKIQIANEESKDLKSLEKDMEQILRSKLITQNALNDLTSANSRLAEEVKLKQQEIYLGKLKETSKTAELNSAQELLITLTGNQAKAQETVVKNLEREVALAAAHAQQIEESVSLEQAAYIALKEKVEQYGDVEASLSRQIALEDEINRRMGIAGQSMKVLGGVLDKFGVGKFMQMDKVLDAMRKKAGDMGTKFQVLTAGVKQLGLNMVEALSDPVAIIGSIVSASVGLVKNALAYQSAQFETAKALGINVREGEKLKNTFTNIAWSSGKLALTSKEMLGTYTEMTKELGIMAPTNEEFLQTSTLLQRRIGASAESMLELQVSSAETGQNMMSTYKNVVGTGKAMAASLKINMSEKQILDSVSKVSATIYNNFHGNLQELTKAVITAKKFGTTLETVSKQGESLLDFEGSISKEFEAQLLTGKDLNLSKARELALNHDTAGLMDELNSKMMTHKEFQNMNVLKQQSFAEALGLSREEMEQMYKTQELQNALGDKANATYGEQYEYLKSQGKSFEEISQLMGAQSANDAQKASVAEQYQATQERTMEVLAQSSQSLVSMVSSITEFFSHAENIKATFIAISAVMAGLVTMSIALKFQALAKKGIESTTIIIKKSELAIDKSIGVQEDINKAKSIATAEIEVVKGGAAATAGSGWMGPLALGVGAAVIAGLSAYLMSAGGSAPSGGGGGGNMSVAGPIPVSQTMGGESGISPTNIGAETKKALENHGLNAGGKSDVDRGANTNVYVSVDPITGQKVEKVLYNEVVGTDKSKLHI